MRSSPVIFSPGTASPLLVVEVVPVEAQLLKPNIASVRKNNINGLFIDR
jgi:hypothetical protein